MSPPARRFGFPASARLRTKSDFDRVFQVRHRASDQWLTLYLASNEQGFVRVGIAVGRRFGNAVRRNRIKRLIREVFRHLRPDLPAGTDWVVMPQLATEATYLDIRESLGSLTAKLLRRRISATAERHAGKPAQPPSPPLLIADNLFEHSLVLQAQAASREAQKRKHQVP